MSIKSVCNVYFNAIHELIENKKNISRKTALNGLCVASYLTMLTPLGFGITLGISKLHRRITKKPGSSEANSVSGWTWVNRFQANVLRSSSAQFRLGNSLLKGHGIAKNEAAAVKWYSKSANQNNAEALNSLGHCYFNGWGVQKNVNVAFEWYKKSAEQGDAGAQENNLGNCYINGWGVQEDEIAAFEWYEKSAEQGNASAQNNLGNCYL